MQIGDNVGYLKPWTDGVDRRAVPGTIVYIHPQGRFFVVRFQFPDGRSCCEAFKEEL